jgi:hypothetical protein
METHAEDTEPTPRRFRILVAGRLDERFVDRGEQIELGQSAEGSTLEGPFIDQSQIRGILDRLWQLGIEVRGLETYTLEFDEPC